MKRKQFLFLSLAFSAILAANVSAQASKMVPARETLEGMGFVSEWDAETKTAVFKNDDNTVSVKAGDAHFLVNGRKVTFDNAVYEKDGLAYNTPVIIDGSFYLPDNELMQAIGADAADTQTEVQTDVQPENVQTEKIVDLDKQLLKDIEGISNARQLGGYVNKEGKKIKQNVIIRTGKPFDATEADLKLLSEKYKVSDMVDFRTDSEVTAAPEPVIEGATNHHIPLNIAGDMRLLATDDFMQQYAEAKKSGDNGKVLILLAENRMLPTPEMYTNYFLGDEAAQGYKQFFDILLNKPEDAAVLFHCTQGKDRTGMGAALFLYALDFDEETIMEDYLLTNEANKAVIEADVAAAAKYTDDAETLELVKGMDGVNAGLLNAATEKMVAEYGSVKDFIKTKIGLSDDDLAKLKEIYME